MVFLPKYSNSLTDKILVGFINSDTFANLMKFVYPVIIAAMLLLWGCKQDLQVTAPNYKDIPVVYSLLNIKESYPLGPNYHYIRIQKGYLLKGNAYLATGIIDSIYYPDNITVQLVSSQPGLNPITLTRVDGSLDGLNKDTGVFANMPNYLYRFNAVLDPNQSYTLQIFKNGGADTLATAVDSIVNNFPIYSPSRIGGSSIAFSNTQPAVLTWGEAQNGGVYDLTIRFYYREYSALTNTLTKDTFIDIPVFKSLIPSSTISGNLTFTLTSSIVTNYLANNMVASSDIYREFNFQKGMQFKFAAGGNALASYFIQQQAQSGLTSSNALPTFTNIRGGLGLLSSRNYQEVDSIVLGPNGLDSLACDPVAAKLNFKNSVGRTCN
jgi:hypothetical protein